MDHNLLNTPGTVPSALQTFSHLAFTTAYEAETESLSVFQTRKLRQETAKNLSNISWLGTGRI